VTIFNELNLLNSCQGIIPGTLLVLLLRYKNSMNDPTRYLVLLLLPVVLRVVLLYRVPGNTWWYLAIKKCTRISMSANNSHRTCLLLGCSRTGSTRYQQLVVSQSINVNTGVPGTVLTHISSWNINSLSK